MASSIAGRSRPLSECSNNVTVSFEHSLKNHWLEVVSCTQELPASLAGWAWSPNGP